MPVNPMDFTPPVVGTTQGPEWAQQINDILDNKIATHDHTTNKGETLSQDALSITGDLSLNNNQLTNAEAVGLATLNGDPSGSNRLYNDSGDLYYKDGNDALVRITQNGGLAAASFGGISGLSGTNGTATFAGLSTFVWEKDVGEYASMENGPITIYSGDIPNPAGGVVLKAKSTMSSNLNVTFPNAAPASDRVMVMSSSGEITLPATISGENITTNTLSGSKIVNESIQNDKIINRTIKLWKMSNQTFSTDYVSSPVSIAAAAGTYVDVKTVRLTTTGRPVLVSFQGAPDQTYAGITPAGLITTTAADQFIFIRIKVNDVDAGGALVGFFATQKIKVPDNTTSTIIPIVLPASFIVANASPFTGNTVNEYDYTLQVARGASTQTLDVSSGVLCAYEI